PEEIDVAGAAAKPFGVGLERFWEAAASLIETTKLLVGFRRGPFRRSNTAQCLLGVCLLSGRILDVGQKQPNAVVIWIAVCLGGQIFRSCLRPPSRVERQRQQR